MFERTKENKTNKNNTVTKYTKVSIQVFIVHIIGKIISDKYLINDSIGNEIINFKA